MNQKKRRFISVRAKILWSLVFVSVPLMIAVVLTTYSLSISRVERIGMQLFGAICGVPQGKIQSRAQVSV